MAFEHRPGRAPVAGRRVIVTGATSGIGFQTARQLAAVGAEVTMAVRSVDRGEHAKACLLEENPAAVINVRHCELANLSSIRTFAAAWLDEHGVGPHVLVNNAGVIAKRRRFTSDGLELTIGTNHLGHFALTGHLMPGLTRAGRHGACPARVVTLTSLAHHLGHLHFEEWAAPRAYRPWRAYAQSKFANAVFTAELHRRLVRAGMPITAVMVHPGIAVTNVLVPGITTNHGSTAQGARQRLGALAARLVVPTAEEAARSVVFAACAPAVSGGSLIGPSGSLQIHGDPGLLRIPRRVRDERLGAALWHASELATGVRYLDDLDDLDGLDGPST